MESLGSEGVLAGMETSMKEELCMEIYPPFKENLATADDWRRALNKVVPAVVVLRTTASRAFDTKSAGASYATGFVVDKRRGIILTNRHVVKPGSKFNPHLPPNMPGKNYGLCHSCREKGHLFADCSKKGPCPWCKVGIVKCFVVEKDTKNKGRMFNCCSANCKYWEWVDEGESSGGSSSVTVNSNVLGEEVQQFSRLFESFCQIAEEKSIEISFNVTIRKANGSAEVDKKGKGLA